MDIFFAKALLFFLLGFISQVVQVALLRELAIIVGGHEFSLGFTLAVWCLLIGCGSGLGSLPAAGSLAPNDRLLPYLASAITLSLPVSLITLRLLPLLFDLLPGTPIPWYLAIFIALAALTLPCLLFGFCFAIVTKHDANAATLYTIEACGCLTGGIFFHFLLVTLPVLPLFCCLSLPAWASITLFAQQTTAGTGRRSRQSSRNRLAHWVLPCLLLGMAVWVWIMDLESKLRKLQWQYLAPGQELIAEKLSDYGYLAVLRLGAQANFYVNGHYSMSAAADDPSFTAQTAHLLLVQHPDPHQILILGGALDGFLYEALKYPLTEIHYCELDPALVQMVRDHLPSRDRQALADARVRVHYEDGRRLLLAHPGQYDMILSFFPEPVTAAINRYYTLEYFALAKAALKPGGVLAFPLVSLPFPQGEILTRNAGLVRTVAQIFPEVGVIPGSTSLVLASDRPGQFSLDPAECTRRFSQQLQPDHHFHPALYETMLEAEAVEQTRACLAQAPWTTPGYNQDLHPQAMLPTLAIHHMLPEGAWVTASETYGTALLWLGWGTVCVMFITSGLVNRRRGSLFRAVWYDKHFALLLLFSLALGGMIGMAAEMVLLWAFLSWYGYLYSMVGLFVALFMLGLTVGAYLAKSWTGRHEQHGSLALTFLFFAMALFLSFLPPLLQITGKSWAMPLLLGSNLLAGGLIGALFPPACYLYNGHRQASAPNPALLYAADMAGAALAALVAGTFAIPAWGADTLCYGLGCICGCAAWAWSVIYC